MEIVRKEYANLQLFFFIFFLNCLHKVINLFQIKILLKRVLLCIYRYVDKLYGRWFGFKYCVALLGLNKNVCFLSLIIIWSRSHDKFVDLNYLMYRKTAYGSSSLNLEFKFCLEFLSLQKTVSCNRGLLRRGVCEKSKQWLKISSVFWKSSKDSNAWNKLKNAYLNSLHSIPL